jgi:hypothetical protein
MRYVAALFSIIFLVGCVGPARVPRHQEEIKVPMSYPIAFEKVKNLLENRGYTIAIADERDGIIETLPKVFPEEEGAVQHRAVLSFMLRGDRTSTIVYMILSVTSDYPQERKEIIKILEGLTP